MTTVARAHPFVIGVDTHARSHALTVLAAPNGEQVDAARFPATDFTRLCAGLHIRQSMGRVGQCFDNAAAEAAFSTLEWEVLSRHHFHTKDEARKVISTWVEEFYNLKRRHSSAGMKSPIQFEKSLTIKAIAA